MERYSENPSGKIKGLGKIIFIIFLIIVVGGNYLLYKDDFNEIKESFKELFEYEYEVNYDDTNLEDPIEDEDQSAVMEYLTDNYISVSSGVAIVNPTYYYNDIVYIGSKRYTLYFNRGTKEFKLTEKDNLNNSVEYKEESTDAPTWYQISLEKVSTNLIIKITRANDCQYFFINEGTNLTPVMAFTTSEDLGPVKGSNGLIYFGQEEGEYTKVYSYDPNTMRTQQVFIK